jgi:hypothetical protein
MLPPDRKGQKQRRMTRINELLSNWVASYYYFKKRRKLLRRQIEDFILCNFTKNHLFITLTYDYQQESLTQANKDFTYFIKLLKIDQPIDLKYLAISERQQNYRLHFHFLCNKRFFVKLADTQNYLTDKWQYGGVNVQLVRSTKSIARYMTKYLSKMDLDLSSYNRKIMLKSSNLTKPKEFKINDLNFKLEDYTQNYQKESEKLTTSLIWTKFTLYNKINGNNNNIS